ncbi:hypothetical protein SAMN02745166_04469 [Prosthecobacter debontii]|uniref:Uncharacterized protein n=1 Tax=Prosthecobacter debontii TaxID=48467 RepID=A0A1T4YXA3_9BACT|nr:hypothetical protein [Prosthecobacter debontii]SKB06420.1 hypothetical protein SAMN02745166_04469 [Prosthecobacter debontii]
MAALIEVKLTELAQLFNSMDPSPFHERDLDHDAEQFIVSWAQEHPRDEELRLIIHLTSPLSPGDSTSVPSVQESVRHYFAYRADLLWREFRQLMKEGRISLLVGLTFLALCQAALILFIPTTAEGIASLWPPLLAKTSSFLREGLTIVGWVAMWRPLEIYLYRWWPLLAKRRLYSRLARMGVEIRPAAS